LKFAASLRKVLLLDRRIVGPFASRPNGGRRERMILAVAKTCAARPAVPGCSGTNSGLSLRSAVLVPGCRVVPHNQAHTCSTYSAMRVEGVRVWPCHRSQHIRCRTPLGYASPELEVLALRAATRSINWQRLFYALPRHITVLSRSRDVCNAANAFIRIFEIRKHRATFQPAA